MTSGIRLIFTGALESHVDGLLLPKAYKFLEEKVRKSYAS